jgi:ABC-type antimicrobial peptide transport system permease subunit
MWVDFNFLKTLKIELVEGRDFDANLRIDSTNSIMLNESAVKALNIENPIGKYLGKKEIIGVVKDFNAFSLHSDIPPILMKICPQKMINEVAIRYDPNKVKALLGFLDNKLLELSPETKQEYYFYDEWTGKIYDDEEQLGNILVFFTSGSILIAILGLLGLSIFFIEKRTKEIGIRKVHGAGTLKIIMLISRDFSILLIPTWLISFPIAWYLLDKWLQKFAYKTSIDWWIYLLCGIAGFIVIQAAISFRTLRAAKINPVETLRYE